ncbi:uncharacterized protein PG998_000014 [Apiospora kogelbergensis]|uniref:uncharacterized protein n=1 Tax=Apiospora kogelbergensis TaxID=1337665 RepID=UPI003131BD45
MDCSRGGQGNRGGQGSRGGRGGQSGQGSRPKPAKKTAAELDLEMEDYWGAADRDTARNKERDNKAALEAIQDVEMGGQDNLDYSQSQ